MYCCTIMEQQYIDIVEKLRDGSDLTPDELLCLTKREFHKWMCNYLKSNTRKRHIYMITFTINPSKGSSEDFYEKAEELVRSTAQRSALKLVQYQYVREYTEAGVPHWHALAVATKPIKKDRFNYYQKKFGNIDISKNRAQQTDEIINYINKFGDPVILL